MSALLGLFCLYFKLAHKSDKKRLAKNQMQFLAHRGLTSLHLENSKEALLAAFAEGADGIEFDVQLSRDLIPMVFHDYTLKRLCGVNKNIDDLSAEELFKLKQHKAPYKDDYAIATLDEVLQSLPSGKLINIELKDSRLMKHKHTIARVLEIIAPHKERLFIVISSFDLSVLRLVAEANQDFALGLLLDRHLSSLTLLRALSLVPELSYLHPHLSLLKGLPKKILDELGLPLILWGHKKMGTEQAVLHHYALISDITSELVTTYNL